MAADEVFVSFKVDAAPLIAFYSSLEELSKNAGNAMQRDAKNASVVISKYTEAATKAVKESTDQIQKLSNKVEASALRASQSLGSMSRGAAAVGKALAKSNMSIGQMAQVATTTHTKVTRLNHTLLQAQSMAGKLTTGFRQAAMNISTGDKALDKLALRLDTASMFAWKFQMSLIPIRDVMYQAIGATLIFGGALKSAISAADKIEASTMGFFALHKNMALATRDVDWLVQKSLTLKATIDDTIESGRILTLSGLDMKIWIDAIADMQAGLNQAGIGMESAARAVSDAIVGEWRRMKNTFNITKESVMAIVPEAFNPLGQITDRSKVELGIFEAIMRRMGGANEAAMQTLSGQWSNFVDKMIYLRKTIGDPIKDLLIKWLPKASEFLDRLGKIMEGPIGQFTRWGLAIGGIVSVLGLLGTALLYVFVKLKGVIAMWKSFFATLEPRFDEQLDAIVELRQVIAEAHEAQVANIKEEIQLIREMIAEVKRQTNATLELKAAQTQTVRSPLTESVIQEATAENARRTTISRVRPPTIPPNIDEWGIPSMGTGVASVAPGMRNIQGIMEQGPRRIRSATESAVTAARAVESASVPIVTHDVIRKKGSQAALRAQRIAERRAEEAAAVSASQLRTISPPGGPTKITSPLDFGREFEPLRELQPWSITGLGERPSTRIFEEPGAFQVIPGMPEVAPALRPMGPDIIDIERMPENIAKAWEENLARIKASTGKDMRDISKAMSFKPLTKEARDAIRKTATMPLIEQPKTISNSIRKAFYGVENAIQPSLDNIQYKSGLAFNKVKEGFAVFGKSFKDQWNSNLTFVKTKVGDSLKFISARFSLVFNAIKAQAIAMAGRFLAMGIHMAAISAVMWGIGKIMNHSKEAMERLRTSTDRAISSIEKLSEKFVQLSAAREAEFVQLKTALEALRGAGMEKSGKRTFRQIMHGQGIYGETEIQNIAVRGIEQLQDAEIKHLLETAYPMPEKWFEPEYWAEVRQAQLKAITEGRKEAATEEQKAISKQMSEEMAIRLMDSNKYSQRTAIILEKGISRIIQQESDLRQNLHKQNIENANKLYAEYTKSVDGFTVANQKALNALGIDYEDFKNNVIDLWDKSTDKAETMFDYLSKHYDKLKAQYAVDLDILKVASQVALRNDSINILIESSNKKIAEMQTGYQYMKNTLDAMQTLTQKQLEDRERELETLRKQIQLQEKIKALVLDVIKLQRLETYGGLFGAVMGQELSLARTQIPIDFAASQNFFAMADQMEALSEEAEKVDEMRRKGFDHLTRYYQNLNKTIEASHAIEMQWLDSWAGANRGIINEQIAHQKRMEYLRKNSKDIADNYELQAHFLEQAGASTEEIQNLRYLQYVEQTTKQFEIQSAEIENTLKLLDRHLSITRDNLGFLQDTNGSYEDRRSLLQEIYQYEYKIAEINQDAAASQKAYFEFLRGNAEITRKEFEDQIAALEDMKSEYSEFGRGSSIQRGIQDSIHQLQAMRDAALGIFARPEDMRTTRRSIVDAYKQEMQDLVSNTEGWYSTLKKINEMPSRGRAELSDMFKSAGIDPDQLKDYEEAYRNMLMNFHKSVFEDDRYGYSERLSAFNNYIELINDKTKKSGDEIQDYLMKIVGAPDDLLSKFLDMGILESKFGFQGLFASGGIDLKSMDKTGLNTWTIKVDFGGVDNFEGKLAEAVEDSMKGFVNDLAYSLTR